MNPTPRKGLLFGAAFAGLFAGLGVFRHPSAHQPEAAITIHPQTREAPHLRFTDARGVEMGLQAFRGRVVLLNVWAAWCAPCREEMPTLDRLQAALGGRDFEVVALSIDAGGLPVVQAFFEQLGLRHLRPYLDSRQHAMVLGGAGIPLTLLIDADGREIGRKLGPAQWDDPGIVALIRRHVEPGFQLPP